MNHTCIHAQSCTHMHTQTCHIYNYTYTLHIHIITHILKPGAADLQRFALLPRMPMATKFRQQYNVFPGDLSKNRRFSAAFPQDHRMAPGTWIRRMSFRLMTHHDTPWYTMMLYHVFCYSWDALSWNYWFGHWGLHTAFSCVLELLH